MGPDHLKDVVDKQIKQTNQHNQYTRDSTFESDTTMYVLALDNGFQVLLIA